CRPPIRPSASPASRRFSTSRQGFGRSSTSAASRPSPGRRRIAGSSRPSGCWWPPPASRWPSPAGSDGSHQSWCSSPPATPPRWRPSTSSTSRSNASGRSTCSTRSRRSRSWRSGHASGGKARRETKPPRTDAQLDGGGG
ncbi:MAG: hypothetical protein AVDCRST_MAG19-3662, partial [uncultured Thermomicrobiales bacterium]